MGRAGRSLKMNEQVALFECRHQRWTDESHQTEAKPSKNGDYQVCCAWSGNDAAKPSVLTDLKLSNGR